MRHLCWCDITVECVCVAAQAFRAGCMPSARCACTASQHRDKLADSIYVSHRSRHVEHTMFIKMTLSLTSVAISAHAASEKRHATCCAALSTITRQQDSISQAHACLASAHLPLSTLHAACIDNMHARLHFVLYKRRGRHALAHGACICDTPPELHTTPPYCTLRFQTALSALVPDGEA